MSRKMQNKMKMIYFQSVKKNYVFCKKRGRVTKGILSTGTCGRTDIYSNKDINVNVPNFESL